MYAPVRRTFALGFLLVTIAATSTPAAPPAPRGDSQFWDDYWQGLVSMRKERWAEAAEAFSRATQRMPADGRPLLARGVVRAITGDFNPAREDLTRARLKSREPKLWEYAVEAMSGTSAAGRGIPIPHSLRKSGQPTSVFGGVPGHMIQGRDDYTTAFASAVIYEFAMPYRAAREAGKPLDSPELIAARTKVGRWFANRMLAAAELTSRNFNEAKQLAQRGQFEEARELLDIARSVYPFDADMAVASGDIWLKVGRPATARRDYTLAATFVTNLAAAYAGRAEAAAVLGDARTARADLAHAARYGGGLPPGLKERVEALLAGRRIDADPAALLAELDRAADGGASVEKLAPIAERLHRAAAGKRVRYDELYQETVRRLEDAIRVDRSAVAPRVELAQYLHDEADLRGEEVEPRRGLNPFRWQYTKAMELHRALHYANQALGIDPGHVPAMVTKAYVLTAANRGTEAERLIGQAMKLAGTGNADATRLLAMYRKRQIGGMLRSASALRTPTITSTTHTENRSDGVHRITTTIRRDPSDADLARAAELERQARALIQETRRLMESAVAATRGTLDGLMLESAFEDWFGSRDKALALLEQAVKAHPAALKAHDALIDYLRHLGKQDAAIRQEAVSWQLFETTCAPLLRLTWKNVRQLGWPAMVKDLERARQLNPTDARATAYLAIARQDARDGKAAVALLKVGAALERARLSLDDQGAAAKWPRPADDLANAMQLHQDLAQALQAAGRSDEALAHFVASGDLALRYPPDGVAALMFVAMRPDANAPEVPVPAPVNGATLASRAHLGAAKALQAVGRAAEARKYLEAAVRHVRPHDSRVPNVGTSRGDTNFGGFAEGAAVTAFIELAKADIAEKRYQNAFKKLQNATEAKPTREESQQINELIKQILPFLNGRGGVTSAPAAAVPSRAAAMIEAAKEQVRGKNYRGARLMLNRAAQARPGVQERREIESLLRQIEREER
jgi:Flp pilus assembly protein TadD